MGGGWGAAIGSYRGESWNDGGVIAFGGGVRAIGRLWGGYGVALRQLWGGYREWEGCSVVMGWL